MSPELDSEPRSIAIVRPRTGLGDLLCTVPALRALCARLPSAEVTLVTFEEMAPVVERMKPWVHELLAFPGYPGIPERPPREADIEPFFEAARARRFDLAIQMYGLRPEANVVTERLGARRTAGFFSPGRWEADLQRFLPYPEHEHEARRHLALMRLLGADGRDERLEFPVDARDEAELAALGLRPGPYACLHPGATSPSRRWHLDHFATVGDALVERGLQVLVTGVPGEEELARGVVERMRWPARDLCGATGLGAFAALLRGAALLVSGDTGAAHLAQATRTPSVTAFLSGDAVRWAGLVDSERHRVARVQVECNPCAHLVCPIDHRCATRLEPGLVLRLVDELLTRRLERSAA